MPKSEQSQLLTHPPQPLYKDDSGVIRFHKNAIVTFFMDLCRQKGICDLNDIAIMPFSHEDRIQFAQLTGYSLCGFSDLSYVTDADYKAATAKGVTK